jgi:N-acetylmuramoyl-L-alanine amidase
MKKYVLTFWPIYLVSVIIFLIILLLGNRTVDILVENVLYKRNHVIIIDAGHGGEDGGAISCTGRLESHINLEIALKLNELCHLLGYETKMIRTTDISVYTEGTTLAAKKASDLRQRVKMANGSSNGIVVSIHQNTFSDSRYKGAQVFYAQTAGSKALANELQKNFGIIDSTNHRNIKRADHVYLMQHIQNTGVLVECGFLSNTEEERKLQNTDYQNKLCAAIVSALSQYIKLDVQTND